MQVLGMSVASGQTGECIRVSARQVAMLNTKQSRNLSKARKQQTNAFLMICHAHIET